MRRIVIGAVVAIGAAGLALGVPAGAGAVSPSAPVFHGKVTKNAKVGRPFTMTVRASGSPKAAITTTTAVPTGIAFTDLGTGKATLKGSFTAPGTFAIGVKATNSQGSVTETLTVTVTGTAQLTYCGTKSGTPTTSKVMVVFEENHDYSAIIGSKQAPTINAIAQACGVATDYQSLTHPSLPNYLAATSGQSYASSPWDSDCSPGGTCLTANDNIFNQVGSTRWKSYAESMTGNCSTSGASTYAPRHNPALYYTDLTSACATDDVPLGTTTSGALESDIATGSLPTVSTVTPNLNDDMHDGTIAQGDSWLATWVPKIVAGPDYQSGHLTVLIVWDEGSGSGNSASTVLLEVLSPYVATGARSATAFTHYSLLGAAESVAGVAPLGQAATANSLRTAFHF